MKLGPKKRDKSAIPDPSIAITQVKGRPDGVDLKSSAIEQGAAKKGNSETRCPIPEIPTDSESGVPVELT